MYFYTYLVNLQYVQPIKCFIMRKIFILLIVSCFCMMGCKMNPQEDSKAINSMTAKEIVEKNVFINMTSDDIVNQMSSQKVSPSFRAAIYRFMKSVTYTDKAIGSSSAKCGADLNMSEELFKHFMEEMDFSNSEMRKADEKGNTILTPVLDEAYFNKLLEK